MAITSRQDMFDKVSRGKGITVPFVTAQPAGTLATANSASGGFTVKLLPNSIGTTVWATIVGLPEASAYSGPVRVLGAMMHSQAPSSYILGRGYKVGTVNLAATGNQFTHDAATFPILKNQMGVSSALNLWPIMIVSTATTTTAPAFILKNSGGTAGYKSQDGSAVVGTKTFTLPAAATTAGSAYLLRVEDGDQAVQDITQVDVTVAGATGAGVIYLFEPYVSVGIYNGNSTAWGVTNAAFNPYDLPNMAPGAATSGTAVAPLMVLGASTNTGGNVTGTYRAFVE